MKSPIEYHVSRETGFLINQFHKVRLDDYYNPWKFLYNNAEVYSKEGVFDENVCKLPMLHIKYLESHNQKTQAHAILSFLISNFVWGKGPENAPLILPKNLAVPYKKLTDQLGFKPILNHVNMVITNSTLEPPITDPLSQCIWIEKTINSNNNWTIFQRETARVELSFAPVISAVYEINNGINHKDVISVIGALEKIYTALCTMMECLPKFNEMDPDYFHLNMRPFLVGWTESSFPNQKGLGYENEDGSVDYIQCVGASAGQSPTLQLFDRLFHIKHSPKNQEFFDSMKSYMLREHQNFLDYIKEQINLKEFVLAQNNETLTNIFNKCLNQLSSFRSHHMLLVAKFILNPAKRVEKNKNEFLQEKGTGGQDLNIFLKEIRDDVKEELI